MQDISSKANKRVLIVGADGTIGSSLALELHSLGCHVTATTRRTYPSIDGRLYLDLDNLDSLISLKEMRFDTAILCAAITSIRACEANPCASERINVKGIIHLACILTGMGTHIIYLSTNMVFDGRKPLCLPDEIRNPTTEYGRQKAQVEEWLLRNIPSSAIIRFGKVLPKRFHLFAQWQSSLVLNNEITPYADMLMAPIPLDTATDILTKLHLTGKSGIFQATACLDISYADAAFYLAFLCNKDPQLVRPIFAPHLQIANDSLIPKRLFNTLQLSSDFEDLSADFSPEKALWYSMADLVDA